MQDHSNLRYGAGGSNYVFLIDGRRHELEAIEPDDCLLVVRICPERMEHIVRANRQVCVIADKIAAESIPRIDRVRAHLLKSP